MKIPAFLALAVCAFSQTGRPSFEVASVKPAELDPAKLLSGQRRIGTTGEVLEMLQTLLEQRFQLKFHHSTKEVPGFELVVAKDGARLKESALDPSAPASGAIQSNSALDNKGVVTTTGPNGVIKQTTGPKGMHLDVQGMTLPRPRRAPRPPHPQPGRQPN